MVCLSLLSGILFTLSAPIQQLPSGQRPRTPLPVPDCNENGIHDAQDIASGRSEDCNGNAVPDECDLGSVVLFSESFENGLPPEWGAFDLWHVTDQCPRPSPCAGSKYAYFGFDDACDFENDDFFDPPFGTLLSPPITIPAAVTSLELSFCSAYEGEGAEPYDAADVFVAGQRAAELVDHVSPRPQLEWEKRRIDLTRFAGETIRISWVFNSMDGTLNNFLGWQVDDVQLTAFGIGTPALDCNANGVPDECEPDCDLNGVPDACEGPDCNLNGLLDSCETAMGLSPDCNGNSIPDECDLEIPLHLALENLESNHGTITGFFPNTYNFLGGQAGTCIANGGISPFFPLYDCGSTINTNLGGLIPYTGSASASSTAFGPDGRYFTAKHEGLFVMAAVDCAIDSFHLGGLTGTGGLGIVDSLELSVAVSGDVYTVYVKRVYDTASASSNQLLIIPGDGAGVTHSFPSDTGLADQTLDGLAGVDRVIYALVSRYGIPAGGGVANVGLPLRPTDAREIARELISSIPSPTSADGNENGIPDECD